jgi:DNA-directed RNA polymerase alpha subunit
LLLGLKKGRDKMKKGPNVRNHAVGELSDYGVQSRNINILEKNGIVYMIDLVCLTRQDLEEFRSFSTKSVDEIINAVRQHRKAIGW